MLDADDLRVRLLTRLPTPTTPRRRTSTAGSRTRSCGGRLANVDAVEASIDAEVLTEEQLTAWMQAINSLRLVLGTLLDINDDDQELAFDPDDPEARTQALYGISAGCSTRSSTPSWKPSKRGHREAVVGGHGVVARHDDEHRGVGQDARRRR